MVNRPEMAGVTSSDSDSAPVPKFLNPGPDRAILQSWESDSRSDSGCNHRSNRNLPMYFLKKWPHRLLLLPKWKSDSGSGFSQIFDSVSGSGSERKTQKPAGVDAGNPDPVPPRLETMFYGLLKVFSFLAFNKNVRSENVGLNLPYLPWPEQKQLLIRLWLQRKVLRKAVADCRCFIGVIEQICRSYFCVV